MKKLNRLFVIGLIFLLGLSGCSTPQGSLSTSSQSIECIHHWIYDETSNSKTCENCHATEEYIPSGYFLSAAQIESESAKEYFNEKQIFCTYDESEFENLNSNKSASAAQKLIDSSKAFYVAPGTTCEILDDSNALSPQLHIVLTSGDFNGTSCWTLAAVCVNDESLAQYNEYKDEYENRTDEEIQQSIDDFYDTSDNIFPGTDSESKGSDSDSGWDVVTNEDDLKYAITAAQEIVKDELKDPSSASFPWDFSEYIVQKKGFLWKVSGYVDADNSYGSTKREHWTAKFEMGNTTGSEYSISNYSVMFD